MSDFPPLARLDINLGAIRRNIRKMRETAAPAVLAPAVKSDCYGLGMNAIAPVLAEEGCGTFFVETFEEAVELRGILPEAIIYVIYGLNAAPVAELVRLGLRPVLSTPQQVQDWLTANSNEGLRSACAVKLNTGMNRLGLSTAEFEKIVADGTLAALNPALLMSHLAFSEDPDNAMNRQQLEVFRLLRALAPEIPASFANSGAIMMGADYHFDLTRPGIGVYGGNPFSNLPNPFEEVVHLQAKIMQVREIDAGQAVGYGATHRAAAPTRTATLGIGYSGGYARSFDNIGWGLLEGVRAPVLGRVSMGSVVVDVSDCPAGAAEPGRYVSLMGGGVVIEELAKAAGRSPYEVLVHLRLQQNRVYRND